MRTLSLVIASHRRWRSNPVNYARAYARLYYDWIATVAMLPRDDKKHHTQFPSMEGCRAAAGWSEKPRKYCHPALRYAATHSLVIASHRRWRGNLFCIVVFHNVSLGRLCALCVSSYLFKLRYRLFSHTLYSLGLRLRVSSYLFKLR